MWHDKTVAVVLPTYRERDTIRSVVLGLESLAIVDAIIVVNNNAQEGTSEELHGTSAREVRETRQGYGWSMRRGLEEANADFIAVMEPDGTFEPSDLFKLLAYADDFDFVYGSRTVPDFIWDGANMGRFLRWGNWSVAKIIEFLFNTPSLSDVGCTTRLVSRDALRAIAPHFTISDGAFGPEMLLLSIIGPWRIVQIPINYRARGGGVGETESLWKALSIGARMIRLILRYWSRRSQVGNALGAKSDGGSAAAYPQPGGEPIHMLPWLRFPRLRSPR